VFKKREVVYGLHLAKGAARERNEIAIVEGYTDVILAHQAGFPWFVATLGTAFGAAHARLLRSVASQVTVFFDGDAAGNQANLNGLSVLAGAVFEGTRPFEALKVASLPPGIDPAELVVEQGPEALLRATSEARSLVDFLVPVEARNGTTDDQVTALRRAARVLSAFESDAYREVQLAAVAHRLGVPETLVREEAVKARRDAAQEAKAAEKRRREKRTHTSEALPEGGRPTPRGQHGPPRPGRNQLPEHTRSSSEPRLPRLERWALKCMIALPSLAGSGNSVLSPDRFLDPRVRVIVAALKEGLPLAAISDEAPRRLAAEITAELELEPGYDYAPEWTGVVEELEKRAALKRIPTANDNDSLAEFLEAHRRTKGRQVRDYGDKDD
jgi:DNA primase